jgi:hypothetical protein
MKNRMGVSAGSFPLSPNTMGKEGSIRHRQRPSIKKYFPLQQIEDAIPARPKWINPLILRAGGFRPALYIYKILI